MNSENKALLKTSILNNTDPLFVQYRTENNFDAMAQWYNVQTTDFYVWKSMVLIDEIMRNGMDWTRVDNLTVGKARIWDWLSRLGYIDPSKANVRAGIDATWSAAGDLAVRAVIYTHCKKLATRFEQALSTGTGTIADPATTKAETPTINWSDIAEAIGV